MTAPAPAPATSPAVAALSRAALVDELAAHLGARHEARFIVDEVLSGERSAGRRPDEVPGPAVEAARAMAARRAAGEPLQYVFGHWPFRALDLTVTPQVLIPRPETEQVVEVALAELGSLGVPDPVVVDAGTGSGAIALALATEVPGAAVWATDVSADALAVATANLARVRHAIARPGATVDVTFVEGSWLEPLPPALRGTVNLVVANPPYVAESEWAGLPAEVRAEPRVALVAASGPDGTPGLACVEAVLEQARTWLTRPGVVVIELAPQQAAAATARATALGYGAVRVEPDLTGRPRCLVAHAC